MKKNLSFDEFIQNLTPVLQKLEAERQKLIKKATRLSMVWGGILLSIGAIISYFQSQWFIVFIAFLFAIALAIVIFRLQNNPLCQLYKKEIISSMVKTLIDKGRYLPSQGITENTFIQSGLFTVPDRYHSEDFISGTIDKTSFHFSEVHAEEKRESSGKSKNEYWVTIFKGFFFIADFHKDFKGHTIVARNSFLNRFNRKRVKLENVEFERCFDVISSDQIEARYLLTPSMMERITMLDKRMQGNIVLSFCKSNVIIAISDSTNHFETSLLRPVHHIRILQREYDLIISMASIVEELNLNTRIWTKK